MSALRQVLIASTFILWSMMDVLCGSTSRLAGGTARRGFVDCDAMPASGRLASATSEQLSGASSRHETWRPLTLRGGSHQDDETMFTKLMNQSRAKGYVRLRVGERGRGLFASKDLEAGEAMLVVPLSACIKVERNATEEELESMLGRPVSEVEDPDSCTWDVRMARILLNKTGAIASDTGAEDFWMGYKQLLPQPEELTQPLTLHTSDLDNFQHAELKDGALQQQRRLRALMPDLAPATDASPGEFPSPMQWAWACVRSRAFSCNEETDPTDVPSSLPPAVEDSGHDCFGFVPFLDMVNHGDPNADFHLSVLHSAFVLRALSPIKEGEEVLINYRADMSNRIYQALYGFVPQGGNFGDSLELPDDLLAAFEGAAEDAAKPGLHATLLEQALGLNQGNIEQILLSDPRLNAVLTSLPLIKDLPADGVDPVRESNIAKTLFDFVISQRKAMTSSLDEDQALLLESLQPSSKPNPALTSAVNYRIERKRLLNKAAATLQGYIGVLVPQEAQ